MDSRKKNARFAGLLYLLLSIPAPIRLIYIPNVLFVTGDASATARNIAAHELLFRLGIVSDLLAATLTLFTVLALYRLLKEVNRNQAVVMVILGGLIPVPIYFLNTLNDFAALLLVRGTSFLSAFDTSQLDALAMMFLRLQHHGVVVNEVFWGLWLVPFGLLVYRSGFLPRILGVWLIINGVAYVIISFTGLLLPRYENRVFSLAFPVLLGEVAMMLWLLIMGAKEQPAAARAS